MRSAVENGVCRLCGARADDNQPVPHALPRGTVLHGRYLVGAVLGAGGFGITYIALSIPDKRRIAIKEFLPVDVAAREAGGAYVRSLSREPGLFPRAREQFLQEAQTIYRLRGYSGIVGVEKLFQENNTAYFCMEYLEGQDLRRRILAAGGRLRTDETMRVMTTVLDALDYIHTRGVIHRDISPDNIYLCGEKSVKLIDFGAAYARRGNDGANSLRVVKQGYAPVEQYRADGRVGPWSDLYACACTIYHCLTGVVPPDAMQREQLDTLALPSYYGVALPPEMESALLKAMSVNAKDRFHSAMEMKAGLLGTLRETKPLTVPVSPNGGFLDFFRQEKSRLQNAWRRREAPASQLSVRAIGLQCVTGVYEGNIFALSEEPTRIGRDANVCGIVLPPGASGVSRVHCEVRADVRGRRVLVRDVGSSYGTQIVDGPLLTAGQEYAVSLGGAFMVGHELFAIVPLDDA